MIDQSSIDLVALIAQSVKLYPSGGKWRGACPLHGGSNPTTLCVYKRDGEWLWNCFGGCGGGDAIAWIERTESVSFVEAKKLLGLDGYQFNLTPQAQPLHPPEPCTAPSSAWQSGATAIVDTCEGLLRDRPLAYLYKRGLTDATIRNARLGYNPADRYYPATMFGFPKSEKDIWLPRGIVIPWFIGSDLWKVQVRVPESMQGNKYPQIRGGSNALYNADRIELNKPAIMVEGVFDALAIQQEASDLIAPVAAGATGARGVDWLTMLAQVNPLLLSFDNDDAGMRATQYWQNIFPHAYAWRSYVHDPAQMLESGMNIRSWVMHGLNNAL